MSMIFEAQIAGRDEIRLEKDADGQFHLSGVGGPDLLQHLKSLREQLGQPIEQWTVPEGAGLADMLVREVILKAQGKWAFPFCESELCHCRGISTAVVDSAVLTGAHDPRIVSEQTSASTACGTCRPDVEAIIKYRKGE